MSRNLWILLLFLVACQDRSIDQFRKELSVLTIDFQQLECRKRALESQLDNLWDSVADSLSVHLPGNMPEAERQNMIAIRNAGLIRMFEIYPALDTDIHAMVENAGAEDSRIAQQIRALITSREETEKRANSFLLQAKKEHPDQYEHWKELLEEARRRPCKN